MALSGRNLFESLCGNFRLNWDDMLEDAQRQTRMQSSSSGHYDEYQADLDNQQVSLPTEKETVNIETSDSRSEVSNDDSTFEEAEKTDHRSTCSSRKKRKPVVRTHSADTRDFNDFLDNYEKYKEAGVYPPILYAKPIKRENLDDSKSQQSHEYSKPKCSDGKKSSSGNKNATRQKQELYPKVLPEKENKLSQIGWDDVPSSTPLASEDGRSITEYGTPQYSPIIGFKNDNSLGSIGHTCKDTQLPTMSWNFFSKKSRTNSEDSFVVRSSTPKKSQLVGWDSTNSSLAESETDPGGSSASRNSSIGWNYKKQLVLSPDTFGKRDKKVLKEDDDCDSVNSERTKSVISRFKKRIGSVFRLS